MQFLKISIHFLSVYLFLRTTLVSCLSTNLPIIKTDEGNFLKVQKQGHEGQKISGYLASSVTFSLAVTCHICARCDQTVIFKQVEKNSFKQACVIAMVQSHTVFSIVPHGISTWTSFEGNYLSNHKVYDQCLNELPLCDYRKRCSVRFDPKWPWTKVLRGKTYDLAIRPTAGQFCSNLSALCGCAIASEFSI